MLYVPRLSNLLPERELCGRIDMLVNYPQVHRYTRDLLTMGFTAQG